MTTREPSRTSPARPPGTVALAAGLVAAPLAALGAIVARLGLLAPATGFRLTLGAVVLGGLTALGGGLVAIVRGRGHRRAWAGTALGVSLLGLPVLVAGPRLGAPAIHDVTTDPDDPPVFVHARGKRTRSYPSGGADVPAKQREAYPDLQPIRVDSAPSDTFRAVRGAADTLGWEITASDPDAGTLEATHTSAVFRFVDDIAVRVRPHSAGGSVVDLRSVSRVGLSDLGANARRIRQFRQTLAAGM